MCMLSPCTMWMKAHPERTVLQQPQLCLMLGAASFMSNSTSQNNMSTQTHTRLHLETITQHSKVNSFSESSE